MYDMDHLAALPTGLSSSYIEMKNSGSCNGLFSPSYMAEAYALPGIPAGAANFAIGLSSGPGLTAPQPPWYVQTVTYSTLFGITFTAYMWVANGGVFAQINDFVSCGDQLCVEYFILAPAGAGDSRPLSAPMKFTPPKMTKDGSDYQGDPRLKKGRKKR